MALSFDKYYKSIPSGYKVIGAGPIDIRQVVNSLNDLYGSSAQESHTWDINGDIITYDGMLVAVTSIKKIYMCIDYLHPYEESSWECKTHYTELNASINALQEEINDISTNRVASINGSTGNYIAILTDTSKGDVMVGAALTIGDVSNNTDGLAKAQDVKQYVDNVNIQYELNSSTSAYIQTSVNIDSTGRIISSSIGAITATLEDASNGSIGLAIAQDVYEKLIEVEEVIASATTRVAQTLGLEEDFSAEWSASSGIPATDTYKDAIERIQEELSWVII